MGQSMLTSGSREIFAGNLYKKAYRIIVGDNKTLGTAQTSTEIEWQNKLWFIRKMEY